MQTIISDDERELLLASTRRLLSQRWSAEHSAEGAVSAARISAAWRSMSEQGLAVLGSDRNLGGLREILLVFEELGRSACPAPLVGAIVMNLLLRDRTDESPGFKAVSEGVQDGSAAIAVCFGSFDGDQQGGSIQLHGSSLTGDIAFVDDTQVSSHFLVFLAKPARALIIPADAKGVIVNPTPGLAEPPLARVSFQNVVLQPEWIVETSDETLADLVEVARTCYAARALGSASRAFDLAVEHAKVRRQFGQFIGQFQAIQHKLADCLIRLDGTRLALDAAATAFDQELHQWKTFSSAAIAYGGPALRQTMLEAHHVLGAIGYAEEHELPRHFRRVHADVVRLGGVSRARAQLADDLLSNRVN